MDPLYRLQSLQACNDLVNDYANLLDDYNYTDFLKLWADEGELLMLGARHQGIEAIKRWLDGRERAMICRHLVTNISTRILSETSAEGRCYTLAFRSPNSENSPPGVLGTPTFLVTYKNEFTRDEHRGWLFARREVRADLVGPEQMRALYLKLLEV